VTPEGWRSSKIGKIAEGITSGSRGWAAYYADSGSPFIRITNLRRTSIFPDYGPMKYVALPDGSNEGRRTELRQGDILVSITADLGVIGYIESRPETPSYISQHIARVRIKSGAADPRFIAYQLAAPRHAQIIERLNDAGAKAGLNLPTIASIPVLLPSLAEQRLIAETLHTWDRAIETVEALIANARAQKRALMQQLLDGKHRLPGFSGEWQRKPINEIATRITRRNDGTDLPVLTISSTSGFVRQDEKYSRFMAGKSVDTYIMLNEGEFAYNKGNSKTYEFGCIFDLEGYARALVPHVYVCFKLKKGYSHRFYKALFEADYLAPQLGQLVNTGVRNNGLLNIKPSEFLGTKVPVPPIDEQDAIAAVMEAASRTVIEHEAQLTALRQEKAALMQQLLTGKRRVKLPEGEVA